MRKSTYAFLKLIGKIVKEIIKSNLRERDYGWKTRRTRWEATRIVIRSLEVLKLVCAIPADLAISTLKRIFGLLQTEDVTNGSMSRSKPWSKGLDRVAEGLFIALFSISLATTSGISASALFGSIVTGLNLMLDGADQMAEAMHRREDWSAQRQSEAARWYLGVNHGDEDLV